MSRGMHRRRRQFSPFAFLVIAIVVALIALCAIVGFFAPAGAA